MEAEKATLKKLSSHHLFSAVNDDMDFAPHSHDFYEIAITVNNGFIHTINGKAHQPESCEIVVLRPGDIHSAAPLRKQEKKVRDIYIPVSMFEEICINLNPSFLKDEIYSDKNNPPVFTVSRDEISSLDERLKLSFFTEDEIHSGFAYPTIIKKAIITEILGLYCREKLKKEKYMPECIIKLLNSFQNPQFRKLSIAEMAYSLGYSHNYLCSQFKACFGKTIQQFLIENKIEKAATLLKVSDLSVDNIGKSLGWSKTSCFIKNFKDIYGLTPLQYRKKYK